MKTKIMLVVYPASLLTLLALAAICGLMMVCLEISLNPLGDHWIIEMILVIGIFLAWMVGTIKVVDRFGSPFRRRD